MAAHALTPFFTQDFPLNETDNPPIRFPYLTLLLSGGHSLLVLVRAADSYQILAESHDMTIGQCLDSIARNLAVDVDWTKESPGAALERFANEGRANEPETLSSGSPEKYPLVLPMPQKPEFSFAGTYTSSQKLLQSIIDEHSVLEVKDLPIELRRDLARHLRRPVHELLPVRVRQLAPEQPCACRPTREQPPGNKP